MMVHADEVIRRVEKILRLERKPGVDYSLRIARVCERFGRKLAARGHRIIEFRIEP